MGNIKKKCAKCNKCNKCNKCKNCDCCDCEDVPSTGNIRIILSGGLVQNVENLPTGWTYSVNNLDIG